MSSKTKIVVLHMKEVIYTGIFLLLLVILGVVMFLMFGSGKSKTASSDAVSKYTPGIYRTSIRLNNNTFDVEVTVDQDQIQSIHLANLSESTSAMFPLVEPVLDSLSSQIYSGQSLDDLEYSSDQKYTALMLIHAIDEAVTKAEADLRLPVTTPALVSVKYESVPVLSSTMQRSHHLACEGLLAVTLQRFRLSDHPADRNA